MDCFVYLAAWSFAQTLPLEKYSIQYFNSILLKFFNHLLPSRDNALLMSIFKLQDHLIFIHFFMYALM